MTESEVRERAFAPGFPRELVPRVDGTPRTCELVRYCCEDVTIKGAWRGPAALQPFQHALAPAAALPVLEAISGVQIHGRLPCQARRKRVK